ncbi:MAG: NADH-quinone oxidoreductase subunit J [Bacteriovoracaceae bacterium]|nr:NADH-quinone oxidoreductase subunit J [Bacteriovoracaceae bacterium]
MFLNVLFITATLLTLVSALGVLFCKNIMHSCIALFGALMGVAGLYITLGADLVAATQVMVYVGGIVILMVFAVMLTGGKDFVSKAQSVLKLAPLMGNKKTYMIAFFSVLIIIITFWRLISQTLKISSQATTEVTSTVADIGYLLISKHVLAFEISSILLLGSLVGAAFIARTKKNFESDHEEKGENK